MKREDALNILRAANERRAVQIDFDLVVDGVTIPVTMKGIDIIEVSRLQQLAIEKALFEAKQEGLDRLPVNEERWQQYVERTVANTKGKIRKQILERLEREKPKNLAEQVALESSWYETGRKYIPRILYVGNDLWFDESTLDEYYQMVQDVDILSLLITKFVELLALQRSVEEAAKNSAAPASLN